MLRKWQLKTHLYLWSVTMMLILVSCSTSGSSNKGEAILTIGSYSEPDLGIVGTALAMNLNIAEDTFGELRVTINGPKGWNNNQPFLYVFEADNFSKGWTWIWITPDLTTLLLGTYSVKATLNGQSFQEAFSVNANAITKLEPAEITLGEVSKGKLTASWSKPNGAKSFLVGLFDSESLLVEEIITSNQITFEDLDLKTGATYYFYVQAFTANFTKDIPDLAGNFKISYNEIKVSLPSVGMVSKLGPLVLSFETNNDGIY